MLELINGAIAPEIKALLIQRGSGIPPLQWHSRPIQIAKNTLDQIGEDKLFAPGRVKDEPMAAAVKALLYLWIGWPADCKMHLASAPQKEGLYLQAMCERQAGNMEAAKQLFQKMDGHPVYAPLASFALQDTDSGSDRVLARFFKMMELDKNWEAFLFADLYEQALAGKISDGGIQTMRRLLCKEAELLFRHCYGIAVEPPAKPTSAAPRNAQSQRKPTARSRPKRTGAAAGRPKPSPEQASPSSAKAEPPIRVMCPKCRYLVQLPAMALGKVQKCLKCGAAYQVPKVRPDAAAHT